MNYSVFRFFHWKVVVLEPHTTAYGHLVLEVLMALHISRSEGAALVLLKPKHPINEAIFHLRSPEVRIINENVAWDLFFRTLWTLRNAARKGRDVYHVVQSHVRQFWAARIKIYTRRKWVPASIRGWIQRRLDFWAAEGRERELRHALRSHHLWLKFQRPCSKTLIPVVFSPRIEAEAVAQADRLGIGPGSRLVTLHVRESTFKTGGTGSEDPRDAARNARIQDFLPAIDYLVGLGYTVVRTGDPTVEPLTHPGVIDLATSPARTDLLEVWCIMRSDFFIGCDSGATCVSWLVNTPSLIVDIVNPLGVYPLRSNELHLLKRVVERRTGRVLSLAEMLDELNIFRTRDSAEYDHLDNTGEDILLAVQEMLRTLREGPRETATQREYREVMERTLGSESVLAAYRKKGYLEKPYVGRGRISDAFAARYLHDGAATTAPRLQRA